MPARRTYRTLCWVGTVGYLGFGLSRHILVPHTPRLELVTMIRLSK
jgi:hypothetical protein